MITEIDSIPSLVNAIEGLWRNEFQRFMQPRARQEFSKDMAALARTRKKKDYQGFIGVALECYSGFAGLTETAETNKTGWHSFTMRDRFHDLAELGFAEFVDARVKLERVDEYKKISDDNGLLVFLPYPDCPFALMDGTSEEFHSKPASHPTTHDLIHVPDTTRPYRDSKSISRIVFTQHGHADRIEPTSYSNRVDPDFVITRRVYFADSLVN